MTINQAKTLLFSLLPTGFARWFDFSPGSFGDKILEGVAEQFALRVASPTDDVDANNSPWTLLASGLSDWETVLGLSDTPTATYGATAQRQAQIVAKMREHGAPSGPAVQALVQPFLGYADPSQIQIVETDRTALTMAHTYSGAGALSLPFGVASQSVIVSDGPKVGLMGAQLMLNLTCSHLEDLSVQIVGPAASYLWIDFGFGAATSEIYLNAPDLAGTSIAGTWTVYVTNGNALAGTLNGWDLFVEGIGRDANGNDGRGAVMGWWAVYADPALHMAGADLDSALAALRRVAHAHTQVAILDTVQPPPGALVPSRFIPDTAVGQTPNP